MRSRSGVFLTKIYRFDDPTTEAEFGRNSGLENFFAAGGFGLATLDKSLICQHNLGSDW
jgi:hypothetical protein